MKRLNLCKALSAKGLLAALTMTMGMLAFSSCSDDDGLTAGDANYFTTSRGQFTVTLDDDNNTTLYLLPGSVSGTATVTFDGSNPRHWKSATDANVNVTTYVGSLTLPETVTTDDGKSYTITAIGNEAFMGCRTLTTLVLPETVQSLGEGSFAVCPALTSVNLPEGITEIPNACFGYCAKLNNVTLPSTVTKLNKMAFHGCAAMTSIILPENLTTIGEQAFFDCPKLTEITIPASVTSIGDLAFGGRDATYKSAITAYHMQGTVPPTLEGTLYDAQEGLTPVIYVPADAVEAYKTAPGWSSLTIEEE